MDHGDPGAAAPGRVEHGAPPNKAYDADLPRVVHFSVPNGRDKRQKMEIDVTPFLNLGIPGILLLWFMLRLERILNRLDKSVQLMTRAIIRLLERDDPDMATSLRKALFRVNGEEK